MGEFVLLKPLFPGNGELDEINKIFMIPSFQELGTPSDSIWEGYSELPGPKLVSRCIFKFTSMHYDVIDFSDEVSESSLQSVAEEVSCSPNE
ncbi:unnamed protein product [Strongylus vulgaris]|uniref:Uncharacterized protein n=1 Tax=Strongylus vulgaris TaxID=40348 RepID=A0A3P7IMF5_STRVU|nr:unnamed protein product [Strongylus vulgaris]